MAGTTRCAHATLDNVLAKAGDTAAMRSTSGEGYQEPSKVADMAGVDAKSMTSGGSKSQSRGMFSKARVISSFQPI